MADDSGVTRDVARAYFEARDRGELDQPAFLAALRVYKGHHPTISNDAARQAVSHIIAEASEDRAR